MLFFGKRGAKCTIGACTLGSQQPEHLAVNRFASAHSAERQFRTTDTRYKIPARFWTSQSPNFSACRTSKHTHLLQGVSWRLQRAAA